MAFMWLRILYLLKTVYNFSIYSDAYAKRLCALYGFENDIWFTIKTQFVVHPERSILFIFLAFTSMFAYIVRIFELPLVEFINSEFVLIDSFFKAFYLCFITITTVGYGDIFPHSWPGKVTMLGAAGIGAIVVSFIITIVQQHFEFNQNQIKIYHRIHEARASAVTI